MIGRRCGCHEKASSTPPPGEGDALNGEDQGPSVAPCMHAVSGLARSARLFDYLADRLALVPMKEVGDLITGGAVSLSHAGALRAGRTFDPVHEGDVIVIATPALEDLRRRGRWNAPWQTRLRILLEDDDLLVVDKPAGTHVHPLGERRGRTLVNALVHHAGGRGDHPWAAWRPHVVQRLDRPVSGLILVARHAVAKAALVREQKAGRLARSYRAMVSGRVEDDSGVITRPIGREPGPGFRPMRVAPNGEGRRALTRWNVIERFEDRSLIELHPETGRTHQLRVHLAWFGHAILGDSLYGGPPGSLDSTAASSPGGRNAAATRAGQSHAPVDAIALRATAIRFHHPRDGRLIEVQSSQAADFEWS